MSQDQIQNEEISTSAKGYILAENQSEIQVQVGPRCHHVGPLQSINQTKSKNKTLTQSCCFWYWFGAVHAEKMDQNMNSTKEGLISGSGAIQHKAYARVGLLGNPSDVYFGKTISFSLANFWASVTLEPSPHLIINPHPIHDLVQFDSLDHLVISFFLSFLFFPSYIGCLQFVGSDILNFFGVDMNMNILVI